MCLADTESPHVYKPVSQQRRAQLSLRSKMGGAFLAIFFAFAPSTVPDWRADPGVRTVAMMPIGEPVPSIDRSQRR